MPTRNTTASTHSLPRGYHRGLRWVLVLAYITINMTFFLGQWGWRRRMEAQALQFLASKLSVALPVVILLFFLVLAALGAVAVRVAMTLPRADQECLHPRTVSIRFLAHLAIAACVLLIIVDCVFAFPWGVWTYDILTGNIRPD